jgi:hypothetical protein
MKVFVVKGMWRDQPVFNMEFEMVSPDIMTGKNGLYVTVKGKPLGSNTDNVRIYVNSHDDVSILGQVKSVGHDENSTTPSHNVPIDGDYDGETEHDAIERINERFEILTEMTEAAASGVIRGMIISGCPGVGKSFEVERTLQQSSVFALCSNQKLPFEIVRGNVSPIGLYKKLFEFKEEGNVLVLDDSDSVFFDPISLSLLKTALDTSNNRIISWNSESYVLKDEGIDNRFEFKGAVVFITNMNLEDSRSKQLKPHFEALISRSHYLDLTIKTQRDKFLRIKGLVNGSKMLDKYRFSNETKQEILEYMKENTPRLRELSLRTTLKISDIVQLKPKGWRRLCDVTICR